MESQLPSSNTSESGITEDIPRSAIETREPVRPSALQWRDYLEYLRLPTLPQRTLSWRPGRIATVTHVARESVLQGPVDVGNNHIHGGRDVFIGNNQFLSSPIDEEEKRNAELIDLLYHVDPVERRDEILRLREPEDGVLPGTCTWLEKHLRKREWLEPKGSAYIWLSGAPGKGKTFLAIHTTKLLDGIVKDTRNFVIYYFFDDDDERHKDAALALKSMMWKMCQQNSKLVKYVKQAHIERRGLEGLESAGFELWLRIFKMFLQDSEVGTVYCVLDSLERCEPQTRQQLMTALTSLQAAQTTTMDGAGQLSLKVLITSLPNSVGTPDGLNSADSPSIRFYLQKFEHLCLETGFLDRSRRDISLWIDHKAATLEDRHRWIPDLGRDVRNKLHNNHDDTYLWISFVIRELEKDGESGQVQKVLQEAPPDLTAYYERMYTRITAMGGRKTQRARQILRTVLLAFRPLTLLELYCLIDNTYQQSSKTQIVKDYLPIIRDQCGNFLVAGETSRGDDNIIIISLFHQTTVRRFLASKFEDGKATKQEMRGIGHHTLSKVCYDYLKRWRDEHKDVCQQTNCLELTENLLSTGRERELTEASPQDHSDSEAQTDIEEMPLLDYALRFWAEHLQRSENPNIDSKLSKDLQKWVQLYAMGSLRYETPAFGMQLVPRCLATSSTSRSHVLTKPQKSKGGCSLDERFQCWFRAYWRMSMPHWRTPTHLNPLHFAAFFDCHWLLDYIAKEIGMTPNRLKLLAEADTGCGMTALHWAARNGHEKFMRRLFDMFHDYRSLAVESKGCNTTPLNWAVRNGHLPVSGLLTEKGASVNKRSLGETPLLRAVYAGDVEHVKLLLASGANVESRRSPPAEVNFTSAILQSGYDYYLWSRPNLATAEHNRLAEFAAVVHPADSAHHIHYLLAMFAVVWATSAVSMCLLPLPLVCQVNDLIGILCIRLTWILVGLILITPVGRVLLHLAELFQHYRAQLGTGHTPLLLAVQRNHYEIVEILVNKGADLEARDWMGRTPVLLALHIRALRIVRLLQKKRANMKAKDRDGRTANELLQEIKASNIRHKHLNGSSSTAHDIHLSLERFRDKPLPRLPDDGEQENTFRTRATRHRTRTF